MRLHDKQHVCGRNEVSADAQDAHGMKWHNFVDVIVMMLMHRVALYSHRDAKHQCIEASFDRVDSVKLFH